MPIVLGGAGDGALQEARRCSAALRQFPAVDDVVSYTDDCCCFALGCGRAQSEGYKPYICASGRYVLALDGWLANREELAALLGLSGGTVSDRALAAKVLLRWGRDALLKMHGDFVLAWWDRHERRLLLAADRTGGRALFYHVAGGEIYFANLVAPLFSFPKIPRVLNPSMTARAAFTPSVDFENTCFQGIKQLLPAHLLEWSAAGGVRVSRYWRLDPSRRVRLRRDQEYVEAAREILDRVVKEALPREGVAASMLSGGLDSSGVAATAARLTAPVPLHTITIRPDESCVRPACAPNDFQDEWPLAQATARKHPSIVAHHVPATLDSLEDMLRKSFLWSGRPPIHLLAGSWLAAGWQKVRDVGAKTVFVGLSGNATLSASILPQLRPGLRDIPDALYTAALAGSHGRKVLPYLKACAPEWLRRAGLRLLGRQPGGSFQTALRPEAAEKIGFEEVWRAFQVGDRRASWEQRTRLRLMERTWVARTLSSCNHFRDGVERRDPLGDVRLAEFCFAIPSDQFTRFGHDRFLARRVLADRLPPEVLHQKRVGRQGAEWFAWATRCRPLLAAELDGIEASSLGRELIDVPRLRAILDDWPADANAAEPRYQEVMNVLGRGVAIGAFVRWAEGANR